MIYVLAGNYSQFKDWIKNNCHYYNNSNFKYVESRLDLLGINGGTFLCIGTYYKRDDIPLMNELDSFAKTHNMSIIVVS